MSAAVAIYLSLGKLNETKNIERIAPPIPIRPAKNPESPPPKKELKIPCLILIVGFKNENNENDIRNIANSFVNSSTGKIVIYLAPRKAKAILGKPNVTNNLKSIFEKKSFTLKRLLKRWKHATKKTAVLRSIKKIATGIKRVELPNPATVATIAAIYAEKKKNSVLKHIVFP